MVREFKTIKARREGGLSAGWGKRLDLWLTAYDTGFALFWRASRFYDFGTKQRTQSARTEHVSSPIPDQLVPKSGKLPISFKHCAIVTIH